MAKKAVMSVTLVLALLISLIALQGCVAWTAEQKSPPIGRFVDARGERMHVLELGVENIDKGPPIVLIHGASANLRDMKIALGDRLSADRRVILIDRPGRGYSTRPNDGHALKTQAALIRETLQTLGVARPVIVGQSFGGAVALAYTLAYQDEITGAVLLAPASHPFEGGIAWYNRVSQWPVAGMVFRRALVPLYAPLVARKIVTRSFEPDMEPAGYYENAGLTLAFRAGDFRSNASDLVHLNRELVAQSPAYAGIKVAVRIFTGDADRSVSPKIHAERLAREIPGAELTVLPETGHALHHAEAAVISAAILTLSTTP